MPARFVFFLFFNSLHLQTQWCIVLADLVQLQRQREPRFSETEGPLLMGRPGTSRYRPSKPTGTAGRAKKGSF